MKGLGELFNKVKEALGFFKTEEPLSARLSKTEGLTVKEAQSLEGKTNMLAADIEKMSELSAVNGVILGFRPVGEASLRLMKESGAVGKPLAIKGKSASEGKYLQGLIPMDAAFSKIGSEEKPSAERIKQFNHKNEHMLEDYSLASREARLDKIIDLYIKEHSITNDEKIAKIYANPEQFLPSMPHILTKAVLKDEKGNEVFGFKDKDGLPLKLEGKIVFAVNEAGVFKDEKTGKEIKIPDNYKAQAVEVVSYRRWDSLEKDRPITADYDQFVAAVPKGKAYAEEKVIRDKDYKPEVFGNVTESGAVITTALRVDTQESMAVHHSQETFNPFPEPIKGRHVFFIPVEKDGKHKCEVNICNSEAEVLAIYNKYEKSHAMAINPLWGWTRDENDKLVVDPRRISSTELATNLGTIKEERDEEKIAMAEKIIDGMRALGAAKVEHKSFEREAKITALEAQLATQSSAFKEKYPDTKLVPETSIIGEELGKAVPAKLAGKIEHNNQFNNITSPDISVTSIRAGGLER